MGNDFLMAISPWLLHPIFQDPRIRDWIENGDDGSLPNPAGFGAKPSALLGTSQGSDQSQVSAFPASLYTQPASTLGPMKPNLIGPSMPMGQVANAMPDNSGAEQSQVPTAVQTPTSPLLAKEEPVTQNEQDYSDLAQKHYDLFNNLVNQASQIQAPGMTPITPQQLGAGLLLAVLGGHNAADLLGGYNQGLQTQRQGAYTQGQQMAEQQRAALMNQAQAALTQAKHYDELDKAETAADNAELQKKMQVLMGVQKNLGLVTSPQQATALVKMHNQLIRDVADLNGVDVDPTTLIDESPATIKQIFENSEPQRKAREARAKNEEAIRNHDMVNGIQRTNAMNRYDEAMKKLEMQKAKNDIYKQNITSMMQSRSFRDQIQKERADSLVSWRAAQQASREANNDRDNQVEALDKRIQVLKLKGEQLSDDNGNYPTEIVNQIDQLSKQRSALSGLKFEEPPEPDYGWVGIVPPDMVKASISGQMWGEPSADLVGQLGVKIHRSAGGGKPKSKGRKITFITPK
jgi:hypothetical protein